MLAFTPFDPWHMLVLALVALLLFGKRLPDVGRSLGKGIMEFKKGLRDVQDELSRDDVEPPPRRKLRPPPDEELDEEEEDEGERRPRYRETERADSSNTGE
jgi:TatA/E family protein of Tat protein translocase